MKQWITEHPRTVIVIAISVVLAVVASAAVAAALSRPDSPEDQGGVEITVSADPSPSTEESAPPVERPDGYPDAEWDGENWTIACESGRCPVGDDHDNGDGHDHDTGEVTEATDAEERLALNFVEEWVTFHTDESRESRMARLEQFISEPANMVRGDETFGVPELGWESQARHQRNSEFIADVQVDGNLAVFSSTNNSLWTTVNVQVPFYAQYSTLASRENESMPGSNYLRESLVWSVHIVDGKVLWVTEPDIWDDKFYHFGPDQDVVGKPAFNTPGA